MVLPVWTYIVLGILAVGLIAFGFISNAKKKKELEENETLKDNYDL